MVELNRLRDPDEIDAYYGGRVHAWKEEYRAKGRAEGIEQGIEQGLERGLAAERELLCRQAARKFGASARPSGWRACSRRSATPAASRKQEIGSSTARRARA